MNLDEAANRYLSGDYNNPEVLLALNRGSDDQGKRYYLLLSSLRYQGTLNAVPKLVAEIIDNESWRHWHWIGSEFRCKTLNEYIKLPPPKGLGSEVAVIERLIQDDEDLLVKFRRQITRAKGGDRRSEGFKGDNITFEKSKRGTSRKDTLERLERERLDLYERVKSGELSANAAAIEAGWRKKKTALDQLETAWGKATLREKRQFIKTHHVEIDCYECSNS